MSAEYLVTIPPGAYVMGVGFVGVGQIFTAPAEDYVPSRHCRAMNAEASAALVKVQAGLRDQAKVWAATAAKADLAEAKKEAAHERAVQLEDQAASMKTDVMNLPKEEPKVRPGLSLKEMGERAEFGSAMGSVKEGKKRTADK